MNRHLVRLTLLAIALFVTLTARSLAADPLPKGATVRLGTTRMRDSQRWTGAALTPDGKHLVAHSATGLAWVDVATGLPSGKALKATPGYGSGQITFAANGKRAAIAGYNGVAVWEVETGKVLAKVERQMPYGGEAVALSADGMTVAIGGRADDKVKDRRVTALVWDVDRNQKRAEVTVVQNQTSSVAISPDGKLLATWGSHYEPNPPKNGIDPATDPARMLQFWDTASGKEVCQVRIEPYGSTTVAFSPDARLVAISQAAGAIRLLDPRTGAEIRRFFARSDHAHKLAFSPDGKTLASAGHDGAVQLWGVVDGQRIATVECPAGAMTGVRGIAFTANDRAVIWATLGTAAFVWEVPSGKLQSPAAGHSATVSSVAFRPDGKQIFSGSTDGVLLRWEPFGGKELGEIALRPAGAFAAGPRYGSAQTHISPDAKTVVVERNGRAIYDLTTGAQLSAPDAGNNFALRPFLCADARTLLLVPSSFTQPGSKPPLSARIVVWDIATGAKLGEFETPTGDVVAAAVAPDRTRLVTALTTHPADGSPAQTLLTGWDLAAGGKKLGEMAMPAVFGAMHITPVADNKTMLVATARGRLQVLDIATGKFTRELGSGGYAASTAPVFSPDGKFVAVASGGFGVSGGTIRIYDWDSGKATKTYKGHGNTITCLAFSHDGKTLASGSADTTVLLWDLSAAGE